MRTQIKMENCMSVRKIAVILLIVQIINHVVDGECEDAFLLKQIIFIPD